MKQESELMNLKEANDYFTKGLYREAIRRYESLQSKHNDISWVFQANIDRAKKLLLAENKRSFDGGASILFEEILLGHGDRLSGYVANETVKLNLNEDICCGVVEFTKYTLIPKRLEKGCCAAGRNNVALICDENFSEATIVSLNSCLRNAGHLDNIFVIAIDCAELILKRLEHINLGATSLHIFDVSNAFGHVSSYKGLVTSAALFKFLLPYILNDIDNVLYIDSDVLVLNDITSLFYCEFNNKYAYVVEDLVGTYEHHEHQRIGASNYFNSGVMHLNLSLMRSQKTPEEMILLKMTGDNIKYMDQDVFNIVFGDNVVYMDNYYNYMTTNDRLPKEVFKRRLPNFTDQNIKLIHYTYKKPWNELDVDKSKYWHEEYRSTYNKASPVYRYEANAKTDIWAENFLNSHTRANSILMIEAAECHGEVMPGFVIQLRQMGFYVDVLFTNNNYELNSLSRVQFNDPSIRIFNNDKYSMYKLLKREKLESYKCIIFTSRSLYYSIEKTKHPTIYEYFKILDEFKSKTFSMEHHLEYVDRVAPPTDPFFVLANPGNRDELNDKVVNFPIFGNVSVTQKNKITTFIVVGNVESERKNHNLLIDTLVKLAESNNSFKLIVVARRGNLDIPPILRDRVEIHLNVSYGELYNLVEKSDYILPMLDPENKDHQRYLTFGTSGTFQLSYGFCKPCVIHTSFAAPYGFDRSNSIVYENNNYFIESLTYAIGLCQSEYKNIQNELDALTKKIITDSKCNLKKIIYSKGKMGMLPVTESICSNSDNNFRVSEFEDYLETLLKEAPPRTKDYINTHRTRFIETAKIASTLTGVHDLAEVGPLSYVTKYLATSKGLVPSEILGDLRFPLSLEDESLDLILCLEVLEHINDALVPDSPIDDVAQFSCSGAKSLLGEIYRVIRPGGWLLLTTPNSTSLDSILCLLDKKSSFLYPKHVREYAPKEVISMAENAGFVLHKFHTIFAWWNYAGRQRNPLKATLEAAGYDMTDRGDDAFFVFRKPG